MSLDDRSVYTNIMGARPHETHAVDALQALIARPLWHAHAACRGTGAAEFFSDDSETRQIAARACAGCPVAEQCREAGRGEQAGVWGGEDHGTGGRPRGGFCSICSLPIRVPTGRTGRLPTVCGEACRLERERRTDARRRKRRARVA